LVIPTDQRFIANDLLALGRHHGLIGDVELIADQRVAQIVLELLLGFGTGEQFVAEEAMDAAAVSLAS